MDAVSGIIEQEKFPRSFRGASAQRAKVSHVILGVFLFQGLLTSALPVANRVFAGTDLSEVMRMVIQNGIILYALTQVRKGGKG